APIWERERLSGAVVVFQDITARKAAERARQEREASFRLLFASNPHPMWVYDLETLRFLEVNAAAIAHYGYTRTEFLAMRITDIRPPEDVPALLANVEKGRVALQQTGQWRHRLKDGRLIDVEITSHRVPFGDRPGALVVAQDVTERKQLQDQLARQAFTDVLT